LELEVAERSRLNARVLELSRVTRDSARTGRVVRDVVRRQIGKPVETVCQAARDLIKLELGEEQKQMAQTVLEHALLVQARLREAEAEHSANWQAPIDAEGSEA